MTTQSCLSNRNCNKFKTKNRIRKIKSSRAFINDSKPMRRWRIRKSKRLSEQCKATTQQMNRLGLAPPVYQPHPSYAWIHRIRNPIIACTRVNRLTKPKTCWTKWWKTSEKAFAMSLFRKKMLVSSHPTPEIRVLTWEGTTEQTQLPLM